MEELDNKTIICSVLFLDIVEYSQKSVSGQISLKEGFNVFLSTALEDIPVTDRIILDTGDGAAISFLGDIEDALKVGLSMRHSLLTAGVHMDTPLIVRMGINLGPVRLVKDINNQPNIVGDGINVAQRVMDFADMGQILVSRSYYDAVSRLSQEYAGMFHYQGSRTDKHVREHEVYAIGYPGEFTLAQQGASSQNKLKAVVGNVQGRVLAWSESILSVFNNGSTQQKALYLTVPVLVIILLGFGLWSLQSNMAVSSKQVVRYYPNAASSVGAITSNEPVIVEAEKTLPSHPPKKVASDKKTTASSIARVRTLEETTGTAAVLNLVVLPWGEVYLDGRMQGVSPPLLELQVAPGEHVIEIKNASFPVFKQEISAKSGGKIKINHTFTSVSK